VHPSATEFLDLWPVEASPSELVKVHLTGLAKGNALGLEQRSLANGCLLATSDADLAFGVDYSVPWHTATPRQATVDLVEARELPHWVPRL
jgi:hypothetical protein